jgi:YD repeat-containing protein
LANGNTSNTEHRTTYAYHAAYSQLTSVTYKQDAGTTVAWTYTLDGTGKHPIRETITVNGAARQKTEWTYSAQGNVTSERRYRDNMTSNVLTEYTYQSGAYLSSARTHGVANADGALVAGTPGYAAGVIALEWSYDGLGRMTMSKDGRGQATSYQYNGRNDVTRVTHPGGTIRQWAYNYGANQVTETDERGTQVRRTYTALGQPLAAIDVATGQAVSQWAYDALCRVASSSVKPIF